MSWEENVEAGRVKTGGFVGVYFLEEPEGGPLGRYLSPLPDEEGGRVSWGLPRGDSVSRDSWRLRDVDVGDALGLRFAQS